MVTYGDALVDRIAAAKRAAREVSGVFPRGGPTELVFTSRAGRVLSYSNWHHRVWAVALAGRPAIGKVRGHAPREAVPGAALDDPQPTCHDLRHTFGTRLADAGVPVHDLMALLGHGDVRSTQRYMHSTEARFERAREALKKARKAG
jgi:integrase